MGPIFKGPLEMMEKAPKENKNIFGQPKHRTLPVCVSLLFENDISGHSHLIKVENYEKLIENIKMRGSDCDFWIFQAFSDKYRKFQSPMFWSTVSRGV